MAEPGQGGCIGVARLGSVHLENGGFSIWLQIRGSSWVEAKEGRFQLQRGEWIALEKDSRPLVREQACGRLADAAGSAGDDRGLPRDTSSRIGLVSRHRAIVEQRHPPPVRGVALCLIGSDCSSACAEGL